MCQQDFVATIEKENKNWRSDTSSSTNKNRMFYSMSLYWKWFILPSIKVKDPILDRKKHPPTMLNPTNLVFKMVPFSLLAVS